MRRSPFLIALTVGLGLASAAMAQPRVEIIVNQLRQQGYEEISVSRTWLGRIRIEAERGGREREIIINRRTGEILRDFWEIEDDDDDGHGVLGGSGGGSGSEEGEGEEETGEDDESEEGDSEDDHSEESDDGDDSEEADGSDDDSEDSDDD